MSVFKRKNKNGTVSYGYSFRDRSSGKRYRKIVPLARTKWEAEQAEVKAKKEVFEKRYGLAEKGTDLFSDFLDNVYLPWSKTNKRSWKDDAYMAPMLKEYFRGKTLREVTPQLVEQFKNDRLHTSTKCPVPGAGVMRPRAAATVNRELSMLSSIYSLAIKYEKAESNPCEKVGLLALDNQRYRYLLPDEEESLMEVLTGPRAHLKPLVIVAIGTGMRQGEQFSLKRHQVDFFRGIVTARKTKNGRDRDIPMNSEVRAILAELCQGKGADDLVFASPRTGGLLTRVKRSFQSACRLAGIEGLWWHDLRATFGTRLATAGHNAFEIAQLMGHSDVRMTMRYVRFIEQSKRSAVEAARLSFQKSGHILATQEKQPPKLTAVNN